MDIYCRYGVLHDCSNVEFFPEKSLQSCMVNAKSELFVQGRSVIIQYDHEDVRKKYIPSVCFYPDGSISHLALQEPVAFTTDLNDISAEFVTFYPSGKIKRIFPRNGKISVCWSEKEELNLLEPMSLAFPFGSFTAKVMTVHFFESGAVYSITLAPGETIRIDTPIGILPVRVGFSFAEDGKLKTVEPAIKAAVMTPIGQVPVYDMDCIGIHGDVNSLRFQGDEISELKTLATIVVQTSAGLITVEPYRYKNPLNENMMLSASTTVIFNRDTVILKQKDQEFVFSLKKCKFMIQ